MLLDLVIPAHNEEHRIDRTLRAYRAAWPEADVRFTVAMDGCTDGTADVVDRHQAEDGRVRSLHVPHLGKGGALMEAFRRCDADLIGFVDADGATPPGELRRLVDATASHDGAIASRRHPAAVTPAARSTGRSAASTGFALAVRALFRLPYTDTQCGAKVLRREVVERSLPFVSSRDFLFDVDLLLVARRLGFDVVEVPTIWIDREGSRVRAGRDSIRMLASALRLWLHHRVLPVRPAEGKAAGAGADHAPEEERVRP